MFVHVWTWCIIEYALQPRFRDNVSLPLWKHPHFLPPPQSTIQLLCTIVRLRLLLQQLRLRSHMRVCTTHMSIYVFVQSDLPCTCTYLNPMLMSAITCTTWIDIYSIILRSVPIGLQTHIIESDARSCTEAAGFCGGISVENSKFGDVFNRMQLRRDCCPYVELPRKQNVSTAILIGIDCWLAFSSYPII